MPTENKNTAEAAEVAEVEVAEQEVAEPEQAAEAAEGAEVEAEVAEQVEGEQPAPKPAPKPGKPNPFRARISELTAEKRALEAKLAEARNAKPPANQQQDETEQAEQPPAGKFVPVNVVNDLVRQEAAKLAADDRFNTDCNAAFEQGTKQFTDFEDAMANFNALGGLERDVIEDALATGAAHQVLYELGSNPDRAAKLLKMPSKQRVAEFTKMTLKAAPKPQVSGAAPPIKPLGGNAKKDFDPLDTSISDEEWHRQEDARERANRRRA